MTSTFTLKEPVARAEPPVAVAAVMEAPEPATKAGCQPAHRRLPPGEPALKKGDAKNTVDLVRKVLGE
jgi:hypothetical protein